MPRFKRRNSQIEALQNDGTDQRAIELEAWVHSHGGHADAVLKGTLDYSQNAAFLRILYSARPQNLVGPGAWVVMVEPGEFYAVTNNEFQILYEEVNKEGDNT